MASIHEIEPPSVPTARPITECHRGLAVGRFHGTRRMVRAAKRAVKYGGWGAEPPPGMDARAARSPRSSRRHATVLRGGVPADGAECREIGMDARGRVGKRSVTLHWH